MKARSVLVGVMGAVAMMLAAQVPAAANVAWCLEDPPAQVQTASGSTLSVNTVVSVPRSQVHYLGQVSETTSAAPDATGTLITVSVTLPAGITAAQITSSVHRYDVSASTAATGGQTVTLYLEVPSS